LAADPEATDAQWQELCELWGSDYRTHITDARWTKFAARVAQRLPATSSAQPVALEKAEVAYDGALITLKHEGVTLVLNTRRGLAIDALSFDALGDAPLCGTLRHGFYDDIHWGADFYTGMMVLESPGRPKLTDLNRVEPAIGRDATGALVVEAAQTTEFGAMVKTIRVAGGAVDVSYRLDWADLPIGSLRLGDITLHPHAFDRASLFYRCHNGGVRPETFPLDGTRVAHADAVSFLVSASHAVGITEGSIELGDRTRVIRIAVDKTASALVGMVTYQSIRDSYFCRLTFSAAEVDETRRPTPGDRTEPLVCRFRITAGPAIGA
jgi:hypothetical protein